MRKIFIFILLTLPILLKAQEDEQKSSRKGDYAKVFPQDKVNRLDIVISTENWNKMINDLETNFKNSPQPDMNGFGEKGEGREFANPDSMDFPPPPDSLHFSPDFKDHPPMGFGPPGGAFPGGPHGQGGMPGGKPMFDFKPVYVSCQLKFDGEMWENVGFRFKGNSSLMMAWQRKIMKLPIMLEFGKFSDSTTYIKDRNFHGFRKLSICNNNNDNSFMHEKLATDLFREAGVHSPHTAFYRIYVDHGEGAVYMGLYTIVEAIEDTFLEDQFGSRNGNCYKPEGQSASFATDSIIPADFVKKTNKKKSNWKDVEHLNKLLHSDSRNKNPEKWKGKLESRFDVHAFVKWLAVNTTIQNWDSYGQMAHNYYLYNDPATGQLVWIPWDNNEALSSRGRGGMSFSMKEVGEQWPLIKYILEQDEYRKWYNEEIKNFVDKVLITAKVNAKIDAYKTLTEPYITGSEGEKKGFSFIMKPEDFSKSVLELKKHIEKREAEARKYLAQ